MVKASIFQLFCAAKALTSSTFPNRIGSTKSSTRRRTAAPNTRLSLASGKTILRCLPLMLLAKRLNITIKFGHFLFSSDKTLTPSLHPLGLKKKCSV